MSIHQGVLARTRAFYNWERRGRGWDTYPTPVALEPPLVPLEVFLPEIPRLDDARRSTFLSRLVEESTSFSKADPPASPPLTIEAPSFRWREPPIELSLMLPHGAAIDSAGSAALLDSLASLSRPISFELVASGCRVEIQLCCDPRDASFIKTTIEGVAPGVSVLPASATFAGRLAAIEHDTLAAIEFGLGNIFLMPLAGPLQGAPCVQNQLIEALGTVGDSELAVLQVLTQPTDARWPAYAEQALHTSSGEPFFADAPELTALGAEKARSFFWATCLRLLVVAEGVETGFEIIRAVGGALSRLSAPGRNALIPLGSPDLSRLIADIALRETHRTGMLLSRRELVEFVRLPDRSVVSKALVRQSAGKSAPLSVQGAGVRLGVNSAEGKQVEVRLTEGDRLRHMHVVGASGTGKSTLLVSMILEDIDAGRGRIRPDSCRD